MGTYVTFMKRIARAIGIGVQREDDRKEGGAYIYGITALVSLLILKKGTRKNV